MWPVISCDLPLGYQMTPIWRVCDKKNTSSCTYQEVKKKPIGFYLRDVNSWGYIP